MKFEFVDHTEFSGRAAHIYSVLLEDDERTLLEQFVEDNQQYSTEMNGILDKLTVMGHDTGCRRDFFKHQEGSPGDGVAALRSGRLRLYCLYFDRTAVFFGSGGYKPADARAYQDVPELNAKAQQMKRIASEINKAIREQRIVIDEDGSLIYNDWNHD